MPSDTHCFLLTALLGLPLEAPAITVHRCESASGHLTFTTQSCASADTQSLQEVRTYLPGTMVPLMPEADARQPSNTSRAPTIVGQAQDTCGNLINTCSRATQQGAELLQLNIATMGGECSYGFTLYNFLRALPIPALATPGKRAR